jgi:hypothetical protein
MKHTSVSLLLPYCALLNYYDELSKVCCLCHTHTHEICACVLILGNVPLWQRDLLPL